MAGLKSLVCEEGPFTIQAFTHLVEIVFGRQVEIGITDVGMSCYIGSEITIRYDPIVSHINKHNAWTTVRLALCIYEMTGVPFHDSPDHQVHIDFSEPPGPVLRRGFALMNQCDRM